MSVSESLRNQFTGVREIVDAKPIKPRFCIDCGCRVHSLRSIRCNACAIQIKEERDRASAAKSAAAKSAIRAEANAMILAELIGISFDEHSEGLIKAGYSIKCFYQSPEMSVKRKTP